MNPWREILLRELLPFERAAKKLQAGDLRPEDPLAHEVRSELAKRFALVGQRQDARRNELGSQERTIWEFLMLPVPVPYWGAMPIPGWLYLVFGAGIWLLVSPSLLVWSAGLLALIAGLKLGIDAVNRRAYRASLLKRCGHCGYSLEGSVDTLPADLVGAHAGPHRCPECALPWPLIPGPDG